MDLLHYLVALHLGFDLRGLIGFMVVKYVKHLGNSLGFVTS